MRRRLLANTAALTVVQAVDYIVPFIVLVHLTKTLGLEVYGVLAFAQGIITISGVLLDFGYGLSGTNKISKNSIRKKYISKLIGGIYAVKFCLFLFCAALICAYSMSTDKYNDYKIIFLLSLIPIFMQGFLPSWFFHGTQKMHLFAFSSILAKIIFVSSVILFVNNASDYFMIPVLNGVGHFFALAASIYFIYKMGYSIKIPSPRIFAYSYKFTKQFFASRVAVASYMNGAIILLGLIAQPAVVAVYSMAEQLYKAMQSALGPVAVALYPYMTNDKDFNLMLKLILGVVGLTVIGAFLGFYIAPTLVEMVFDQTWLPSISVLNIFLVAIVVHAATVMTGYPLAALVNRLDVANVSVMTGAVVYFVVLVLIFHLDLVTPSYLAMVMLISELSVFFHRFLVLVPLAIRRSSNVI